MSKIAGHTNTLTPSVLEIIKINIFFRPGRSHVRNWRKLVLSLKILVLLKRIFDLHISKQNEKHPYTYLTMSDKFFIPNLMHYLRSYIKGCHICQLSNKNKIPNRHFQRRINLNYKPFTRLSMDLKVMPKSYRGHKFILCVIDEMTNYLITMPIYKARSEEIGDSLIDNVISKFGIPKYLIMDQDSSFMSTIMNDLFRKLNIR